MGTTITVWTVLHLLGLLASLGVGAWFTKWAIAHLPTIAIHTKWLLFNTIANAVGNAAVGVVKSVLSHVDLDALLTALAQGTPLQAALKGLLPQLTTQLETALGPALTSLMKLLLGNDTAAATASNALTSAVHDLVMAHKQAGAVPQTSKNVVQLASGRFLVQPREQAIPVGAQLISQPS